MSPDHARKALRVLDLTLEAEMYTDTASGVTAVENEPVLPNKASVEINKDGTQTHCKLVRMTEENSKDASFLLYAHGYNPDSWELVSAKSNIWNAYSKQDGIMELYSSKITVKPITNGLDINDIACYFENLAKVHRCKVIAPKQYEYGAEYLVPCLFDVHFGKLADIDETGFQYDYKIARERLLNSVKEYINKFNSRKFEKILFAVGNDYFNSEPTGDTVNSTRQDNDTRYSKMFKEGIEALIEIIDMFTQIAPVKVILVQGNHSFYTEFYGACVLSAWYRNCKNVEVDDSPTTRKYEMFGNVLLGFTHGSEEKDRIYGLMQHEAADAWGEKYN